VGLLAASEIQYLIRDGVIEVTGDGLPDTMRNREDIAELLQLRGAKWEVRIGEQYTLMSEAPTGLVADRVRRLSKDQSFFLAPGDTAIVRTRERIQLPTTISGLMTSKLGPTLIGLAGISTTVDPGFQGYLVVALVNLGGHRVELRHNDPVAALSLFRLATPAFEGSPTRAQEGDLFSILYSESLRPWIERAAATQLPSEPSVDDVVDNYRRVNSWEGTPHARILAQTGMLEKRLRRVEAALMEYLTEPENQ
jgi:deoxycytidine triphosphate deaminase